MQREVKIKQPVPIFSGNIVENKLKLFDHERKAISRWISTFKNGTKIDIVIRKHTKKRTNDQNKYYWGIVIPILADYFGYDTAEDVHADLKLKFNPIQSKIDPDKTIGGTTTKLSTVDFYSADDSYVERICRWASEEFSIYIPPPQKSEEG
jgi:hypothetical protein